MTSSLPSAEQDRLQAEDERVAIPLAEEQLSVSKQAVETGTVRVRTVTDTREVQVSEELLHTEADVRRVSVNQEIASLPQVREEGDTLIVPVIEERLVKRLFLVEEVHIRRDLRRERLERPVTLRSQHAVVERDDAEKPSSQSTGE